MNCKTTEKSIQCVHTCKLDGYVKDVECDKPRLALTLYRIFGQRSQWSSGNTLACCTRGPRFESRCGQKFVFSRKSVRYAALGTSCTLTAVPRSTQPSTLRGTVSALWLSNNTWRWANVRPMAAYRWTQRSSLQPGLRVGGHLSLTDFGPEEPQ